MAFYTQTEVSLRQNMPGACDDKTMTQWRHEMRQTIKDNRMELCYSILLDYNSVPAHTHAPQRAKTADTEARTFVLTCKRLL